MIRSTVLALLAIMAGAAEAQTLKRFGLCEASAAEVLPPNRLVVASDDDDRLAVYRRGETSALRSKDLGKVDDIEGAARIGDTIFWVTSHSLTGKGKDKKRRRKLLATRLGDADLPQETGKMFKGLRRVVRDALTGLQPGTVAGDLKARLDIEGLAATPDGALLVALRAPLTTDGRALLVQVPRPFALLDLDQPPISEAVAVVPLDLGGRGVRGIARDPGGSYVLIAGPSGDGGGAFDLYTWSGSGRAQPVAGADLSGMKPEALVIWESGLAEVFGDNGKTCSDSGDVPEAERWFPSRMVRY